MPLFSPLHQWFRLTIVTARPIRRPFNNARTIALATGVLCAVCAGTRAQDEFFWEFAASGNWSDSFRWDPDGQPGSVDAATILIPGTYTVTVDTAPFVRGFALLNPDALVELNGVANSMTVGADTLDAGSYLLGGVVWLRSGAQWLTPGPVYIEGDGTEFRLGTGTHLEANTISVTDGALLRVDVGGATIVHNESGAALNLSYGTIGVDPAETLNLAFDGTIHGGESTAGIIDVASASFLYVRDLTIAGVELRMGSNSSELRNLIDGGRLELEGAIIRGGGQIGRNELALTVDDFSSVVADAARTLTFNTINEPDGLRNNGLLAARDGATLRFIECNVNNAGGEIRAEDDSLVTFTNSPMIVHDGLLHAQGTGRLLVPASTEIVQFDGVTISGILEFEPGSWGRLLGTISNNDAIALGLSASVEYSGDVMLTGMGVAQMSGGSATTLTGNDDSARLTIDYPAAIRGSGTFSSVGAFANFGLIEANSTNTLHVHLNGNDSINRGTIRATDGAALRLNAGVLDNDGGIIEAVNGGTVALDSNAGITRGTLRTDATGLIFDDTSTGQSPLTDVTLDGQYLIPTGQITRVNGFFKNLGHVRVEAADTVLTTFMAGDGATLVGGGTIQLVNITGFNQIIGASAGATLTNVDNTIRGAGHVCNNQMSLINQGTLIADETRALVVDPTNTGLFRNEGLMQATGPAGFDIRRGPFDQAGQVEIFPGSRLQRSTSTDSDYNQSAGSTRVDGELLLQPGRLVNLNGGSLSGIGLVTADVRNNAAVVAPGASPGTLTIDGPFTHGADGQLDIELAGHTPGTEHDVLAVTAAASLGGTLRIRPIGGFVPQPGQQFTILTAGSLTGQFADVTGPGDYSVAYSPAGVVLTVVISPIPGDLDGDDDVDLSDYSTFAVCFAGPGATTPPDGCAPEDFAASDLDGDGDVDLGDFATFSTNFGQ